MTFKDEINTFSERVNKTASANGFRAPTNLATSDNVTLAFEKLCLIHSEVSEAVEIVKLSDISEFDRIIEFGEELADIIIRVLHLSSSLGISIGAKLEDKQRRNELRPYMHGKRA